MKSRVTMADVARQAGVHVTTVSLALRNHPSLPATTRERLQSLARDLGYQPDPALQALVAYRRRARPPKSPPPLAYITNWSTRFGWKDAAEHGQFFAGADFKARELGYHLEHFWLGEPKLTSQRLSDILTNRGINGIIIASQRLDVDTELDFEWARFSAVKIDFVPHRPVLHTVTNDQRAIVQLAMRRAIAAGYRRIGFVMRKEWDDGLDLAWSAGFLAEQLSLAPKERIPILFTPRGGPDDPTTGAFLAPRELFETWLRRHRPDALISYGPFVLPHLEAMKLSIPGDLAFIDIVLDRTDGRVAGVRHNSFRVGEVAVEILAGQLQQNKLGIPQYPAATFVEGTWFDGASLPNRAAAGPTQSAAAGG